MMRVGVIGGGQLAWMMATAAQKLDIALVVQTPDSTDPAVSIASQTILAAVADAQATAALAQVCEVITFENEFVDLPALMHLADQGVRFYPQLQSLAPLLDKLDQRNFLQQIGVPTPPFTRIEFEASLESIEPLLQFGLPAVLKARRHGYDGQGTLILKDRQDLDALPATLTGSWLLEAFVPFERELAVMVARSRSGEIVIYPVVETVQQHQVCQRVYVLPASVDASIPTPILEQVSQIAHRILAELNYVGILGIEFFQTQNGQVFVNELAPRTHNSGHYSLDACVTSQFEQQLRAVCGLPLGSPDLKVPGAVMVNLLGYETSEGNYVQPRQRIAALPQTHLYWYGKASRPGRKLGHVTVLLEAGARSQAAAHAQTIEQIWYGHLG